MDLTMMERVGDRWEKNGRILFDRPKPTVGCSASGTRRRSGYFYVTLVTELCRFAKQFKKNFGLPVQFK
jgi:hypothetical protein